MVSRFLVVPQWQGSGSSRAMRLSDGANAIAGDLPAAATTPVEVRVEAGEGVGTGIHRASAIMATRLQVGEVLDTFTDDETVIVVGGDCGADLAPAQRAIAAHPAGALALVWFDAHGDLHTPDSSPSGSFSGMVLRTLLGDGADGLVDRSAPLSPALAVLAGARSIDPAEAHYLTATGLRTVSAEQLTETPAALADAVASTGATSVYVHVDLDVLDPALIDGVAFPEPFGVSIEGLTSSILALRERFALVGAAVTGFAPASPDEASGDLGVILRVLGALTRPVVAVGAAPVGDGAGTDRGAQAGRTA